MAAFATFLGAWIVVSLLLGLVPDAEQRLPLWARMWDAMWAFADLDRVAGLRGESVGRLLWSGAGQTLWLIGGSVGVIMVIGISSGVGAALWKHYRPMQVLYQALQTLSAVPVLVWSFVLLLLFSSWYYHSEPAKALLPVAALALGDGLLAGISRSVRMECEKLLQEDFVRALKARGVPLTWHLFRGLLAPAFTALSGRMAYLIGGSVVVEYVFDRPGLGIEVVRALTEFGIKNYPFVLAATLVFVGLTLIMQVLRDACALVADPRLR